jgi:hypothetical protein
MNVRTIFSVISVDMDGAAFRAVPAASMATGPRGLYAESNDDEKGTGTNR